MACFESLDQTKFNQLLKEHGTVVLFKHSTRCSISSTALNRVSNYCQELDLDHRSFLIPVIEQRDLSNLIASSLDVQHQSPQLIILKDGKVSYNTSHFGIDKKSLLEAIH